MKTQIKILIHSFVDLITNSSTEIFVEAGEGTIKAVKEIIDGLLSVTGSDKKADDLFDFSLGETEGNGWCDYTDRSLTVTAKDPALERTAQILSRLDSLFHIEAERNS